MEKKIFLYTNPDFDKRFNCGISRLYNLFTSEGGYMIELVNLDFLRNNRPVSDHSCILVIAGGDGTIHQAINAIPEDVVEGYLIGIIPAGTANELAKTLGIPVDIKKAADLIMNPRKIYFYHIGVLNDECRFMTGLLYGFAVTILHYTSPFAKRFFGNFAFFLGFLRFFFAQFNKNRKSSKRTFIVNSREIFTNFLLVNNASLTSKELNYEEIKNEDKNLFSIVYMNPALRFWDKMRISMKNHARYKVLLDRAVVYNQSSSVNIEFEGLVEFMLDGEVYKFTSPLTIKYFKHPVALICG